MSGAGSGAPSDGGGQPSSWRERVAVDAMMASPPLSDVTLAVIERGCALGLTDMEMAGILGLVERDWTTFLRRWPHVGADARLEGSIRVLCDLLGAVLAFAGPDEGACWMRSYHPAMGDSPLGRLIRSPPALRWLRDALVAEGAG